MRRTKILVIAAIAATVTGVCLLVVCTLSSGVAVVSDSDLAVGSHVYIVNTDGTGFIRLDDVDSSGTSPFHGMKLLDTAEDGSKTAFSHEPEPFGNTDAYMFDWDSKSLTKVASETNTTYDFSPDFSKIACFDGTFEGLHIMNGDGSGRTRIEGAYKVQTGYSKAIWSPDSSKIVYHWKEIKRIYIVDVKSYTRTEILDYSGVSSQSHYYVVLSQVSWSPDSTKLYYIGEGDLYEMNADGMDSQKIAGDITDYYSISPDGSRILYKTHDSYYVMNADGSGKTELFDDTEYSSLRWSPDSSKIAYQNRIEDTNWYDLYVMNANGSDRTRLTRYEEHGVTLYEWSPDSGSIYYLRVGDQDTGIMSDIYVTSTDRTYFAKLTDYWNAADRFVGQFYLSPDGKKIAYQILKNMQIEESGIEYFSPMLGLYVMNTDGTGNKKFIDCRASLNSCIFSSDGSKLLFGVDKWNEAQEE